MRSPMLVLTTLALLSPAAALAQTAATPDDRDAIVCQLLANCPPAPTGNARTSNARGFSFTRPADKNDAPSKPRRPSKPTAPAAARTTAPGQYDLRVTFVSGSDVVSAASRDRVRTFATALNDPRLAARRILIEGHTDSVGSPESNLDLSRRRAQAVADLVAGSGVDMARLDVEGYGQTRPLPGLSANAGANRRVVASLVK